MKIWVIRVWWLWDSIVFSPFLRELRKLYPNDEISLFVQHNSSWEYFSRLSWYYDKLEYIDRRSSFITKIKYFFKFFKRYDLIIDTINGSKLSCITANLFWKKTIWFCTHWKYTVSIKEDEYNHDDFKPLQDLMILKILKNIDIKHITIKLDFPLYNDDYIKANNYDNYCVFHTWWSSWKTWYYSKNLSTKQIQEIIDIIISTWYTCIIIWSKNDEEIKYIKDKPNLIKLTNLSIWELWYLIKWAELYIWWNSWPMRISMALNKRSIVISSATAECWQPQKKYFPNVNNIVSDYNGCSKCWLYTCKFNKDPKEQWLCIKNLDMNIIRDLISNNN